MVTHNILGAVRAAALKGHIFRQQCLFTGTNPAPEPAIMLRLSLSFSSVNEMVNQCAVETAKSFASECLFISMTQSHFTLNYSSQTLWWRPAVEATAALR